MTANVLVDAESITELTAFLIPVKSKYLVLPNVSVAELIAFSEPEPAEDVPTWYLGTFYWREQNIPLISFEAINDEPFVSRSSSMRIAVFNGLNEPEQLPFFGIITQGTPRMVHVSPTDIVDIELPIGPAESMIVSVVGDNASIPNLEYIESQIVQVMNRNTQ